MISFIESSISVTFSSATINLQRTFSLFECSNVSMLIICFPSFLYFSFVQIVSLLSIPVNKTFLMQLLKTKSPKFASFTFPINISQNPFPLLFSRIFNLHSTLSFLSYFKSLHGKIFLGVIVSSATKLLSNSSVFS